MCRSRRLVVLFAVLVVSIAVPASGGGRWGRDRSRRGSCPADVAQALAESCPCDSAANHGAYVNCVAHFARALRWAGCPNNMLVFPCAARSTCGSSSAAVICCLPVESACDSDGDCTRRRGRIAPNEATCTAAGGIPAGRGSACGACATSTTTSTVTTTTTTVTDPTTTTTDDPTTTTTETDPTTTTTSSTTTTTLASGFTYGNADEFPAASDNSPDFLVGTPLMVTQPSVLTHLCVITKAAGPNMMLALYTDSNGLPDQLVASIPSTPMTLGRMEIPVAPMQIPAGTYWMMGVYDAEASIGLDESDPNALDAYASQDFSSPLPDPFGPAGSYTGQKFNYYVRVE
jgi:hypothetical protein